MITNLLEKTALREPLAAGSLLRRARVRDLHPALQGDAGALASSLEGADVSESEVILGVLALVDLTLMGSLIIIVIFSGYENFVSKVDETKYKNWPEWMSKIDFTGLKLKLLSSIVAISGIQLLKAFMNVGKVSDRELMWLVGIHIVFVVTGVLLRADDKLSGQAARASLFRVQHHPALAGQLGHGDRAGGFALGLAWGSGRRREPPSSEASHRRSWAAGPAACTTHCPRGSVCECENGSCAPERADLGEPAPVRPAHPLQTAFLIAALSRMRSTFGCCAAMRRIWSVRASTSADRHHACRDAPRRWPTSPRVPAG